MFEQRKGPKNKGKCPLQTALRSLFRRLTRKFNKSLTGYSVMAERAKLGVAVVGDGGMALVHARHVVAHSRLTLRYLVGHDTAANVVAAQFGAGVVGTSDLSVVLADEKVAGVLIASPISHQFSQISQVTLLLCIPQEKLM